MLKVKRDNELKEIYDIRVKAGDDRLAEITSGHEVYLDENGRKTLRTIYVSGPPKTPIINNASYTTFEQDDTEYCTVTVDAEKIYANDKLEYRLAGYGYDSNHTSLVERNMDDLSEWRTENVITFATERKYCAENVYVEVRSCRNGDNYSDIAEKQISNDYSLLGHGGGVSWNRIDNTHHRISCKGCGLVLVSSSACEFHQDAWGDEVCIYCLQSKK